jgi:hypothetical protein
MTKLRALFSVRRLSFFHGLAAAACVLAPVSPVSAAGLPLVVVHRTEDAAGCPDARALAALVATQMKRPALEPAAEGTRVPEGGLDVQIYRSEQGFTAIVQAGGKTRQLSDQGTTCKSLAVALSISIAVLLDTEPLPPGPEPVRSAPEPGPVPVDTPATVPTPTASATSVRVPPPVSSPAEPPATPPGDERESSGRHVRISLAASPLLTVGVLQSFAGGFTTEVEIRVGRFSFAGGVVVLPGQSFTYLPGQVKLDLTAGLIRGCGRVVGDEPLHLALCVDAFGGAMRGAGQGFGNDDTTTLPWAAGGTSAIFHQRIWGPLSWGARAGLLIPFVKTSFSVQNGGTAFNAPPIGGAWNAELRVSIW